MINLLTILILFLLFSTQASSAVYELIEEVGSSAENVSIGNIQGFSKSAAGIFENPATLVYTEKFSFSHFSTEPILGEVTYQNYAASFRTDFGVFGIGYMDLSIPDNYVTGADEFDEFIVLDSFTYRQSLTKLAFQNSLDSRTHIGFSVNLFNTELHELKGTAVNLDAGILIESEDMTFSAVAKNLMYFSDIKYNTGETELAPTQFIGSFKYDLNDNWAAISELKVRFNNNSLLSSFAIQYYPIKEFLTLSIGRKEFYVLDEIKDSLTFGASVRLMGLSLGFAYEKSPYFEQDMTSYVSIGFDLGLGAKKELKAVSGDSGEENVVEENDIVEPDFSGPVIILDGKIAPSEVPVFTSFIPLPDEEVAMIPSRNQEAVSSAIADLQDSDVEESTKEPAVDAIEALPISSEVPVSELGNAVVVEKIVESAISSNTLLYEETEHIASVLSDDALIIQDSDNSLVAIPKSLAAEIQSNQRKPTFVYWATSRLLKIIGRWF